MAFFSGFPFVYALVLVISGYLNKRPVFKTTFINLLPISYAVVGVLFLGLQLKKLYPDYSFNNISAEIQNPFLAIWGILSIIFFLPFFRKRIFLCLMHSLVFFFLVIKNIFLSQNGSNPDNSIVKNSMNVYTSSLTLNLAVLIILLIVVIVIRFIKRKA